MYRFLPQLAWEKRLCCCCCCCKDVQVALHNLKQCQEVMQVNIWLIQRLMSQQHEAILSMQLHTNIISHYSHKKHGHKNMPFFIEFKKINKQQGQKNIVSRHENFGKQLGAQLQNDKVINWQSANFRAATVQYSLLSLCYRCSERQGVTMYLLYHEKSLGMLAFAFLR